MTTITINGDNIKLSDKAFAAGKVQFADISEKCSECGNDLEEAGCIRGTDLVCGCGQKYPITTSAKSSKEEPVKNETKAEKPVKAKKPVKTEKPVKLEKTKPTKAVKVEKPAAKAEKVKSDKKEATAREGSINSTKLIDSKKGEPREGSAPAMIIGYFKKAVTPVSVVDDIVAEWRKSRDMSASFEKNPRGYISWYVLDLLRKGWLKKA